MDLTGDPDGEPRKIGVAFADIITGLYSVIGIKPHFRKDGKPDWGSKLIWLSSIAWSAFSPIRALTFLAQG